ncbi:MAG TPA: hypothetical protein VEJ88_06045, partial [Dissulfurispiraceae bacterium]|nr:hypothetical protein [Dissulfurispiraceae bacterium]
LSRRTTHKVDLLITVSDPTVKGVLTAQRINSLVEELQLEVERRVLIINRVIGYEGNELKTMAEKAGVIVAGLVPQDEAIFKFDLEGKPVFELPEESKSVQALFGILSSLNIS